MKDRHWDRRRFLKAAAAGIFGAGAFLLSSKPSPLIAGIPEDKREFRSPAPRLTEIVEEESFEERERAFAGDPFETPDLLPVSVKRSLRLFNVRTNERLDLTYRDSSGRYDPDSLSALNRFLRCPFTHKETEIDVRVIEFLNSIDKSFGGNNEIYIISGYRTPEYHRWLKRRGSRPAKNSLHLVGKAIDFRIPGVRLRKIKGEAVRMRFGGVGYYPRRGFVHIDSGRFRYW